MKHRLGWMGWAGWWVYGLENELANAIDRAEAQNTSMLHS